MRTTLDIEDSVLQLVKELARRDGRSAGAVASELIRRGLAPVPAAAGVREPEARHGFRPFSSSASEDRVTSELVNRLRDELGV